MSLTIDFPNSIISVSADQTALTVEELYDFIKDVQDSELGVLYPPIAQGAGKFELGSGRTSGLTVSLNSPWQVEFLGTGQRTIDGGVLVGGLGNQPVKLTANTQVILNRPADAFGVATSGSTGPSSSEIAAQVRASLLAELTQITELAAIHGLLPGVPLQVSNTARVAGAITQTISDGDSETVVARV